MDKASGPWHHAVENTRLRCHLLLSNIIGLEGSMLRSSDAALDWTHTWQRGVAQKEEFINRSVWGTVNNQYRDIKNDFQMDVFTVQCICVKSDIKMHVCVFYPSTKITTGSTINNDASTSIRVLQGEHSEGSWCDLTTLEMKFWKHIKRSHPSALCSLTSPS